MVDKNEYFHVWQGLSETLEIKKVRLSSLEKRLKEADVYAGATFAFDPIDHGVFQNGESQCTSPVARLGLLNKPLETSLYKNF